MNRSKPGDRVDVKVKAGNIISPHLNDYDEVFCLDVITFENGQYYLFVPQHRFILGTIKCDKFLCRQLNIDFKFVGDELIAIKDTLIHKYYTLDGMFCDKCKTFCEHAAPNRDDGLFRCWSCRQDPYRGLSTK